MFSKSALEKDSFEAIKERYNARSDEVFKLLDSDKELASMNESEVHKFAKYNLQDVEYSHNAAAYSAIEFITGLKQFREEQTKRVEERMTQEEDEIVE